MSEQQACFGMLDVLCPMHVVVGPDGRIAHAGPTACKFWQEGDLRGRKFIEVFDIRRPRPVADGAELAALSGAKLHIRLRVPPHRELKGVAVAGPLPQHVTVNLSFGISVVDAIQNYDLTAADFAATDLTIEMLYLVEAKSAAMEASHQLNQRLQSAREAAEEQAVTDPLTGLNNRRAMDAVLAQYISAGRSFALMQIDLDFFKAVNDTFGHAAGDHVLLEVARIMMDETRAADTVARVGGDEFIILLHGDLDRETIAQIAHRIISRMTTPIPFEGAVCRISASIGSVQSTDYIRPTADQLLKDADEALYHSKRTGRERHTFFAGLEPDRQSAQM